MRIEIIETYQRQEDGTLVLISTEEVEVSEPTDQELIAQKEQQLLELYEEIQRLKNQ